jgi:hypothetical protein
MLILPQLGYPLASFKSSVFTLETHGGYVSNYLPFLSWYWFGAVAPLNISFYAVFSYVVYKQYKLCGSDAWRRLARDGIQTTCLVIACNTICIFIIILEISGDFSEMSVPADW